MREKIVVTLILFVAFGISSCDSNKKSVQTCNVVDIESFSSFLGLTIETPELEIKRILGQSTEKEYSEDRLTFIYEFDKIETIPVTVYVDAESGRIKTIFIELLGLGSNYSNDLRKVKSKFPLSTCHAYLFGMSPNQVMGTLGSPDYDEVIDDNVETDVRSLVYLTEDGSTDVTLYFYPSQQNRLGSINVDWYVVKDTVSI